MKCNHFNFIFIDICKNAGTSINASFQNTFPDIEFEGKHHSIPNYTAAGFIAKNKSTCSAIDDKMIKEYSTFSVIRNPWDRIVSLYLWGAKRNQKDIEKLEIWWSGLSFSEFVYSLNECDHSEYNGHRYTTQLEWISNKNGEVVVNNLLMYENLQHDFSYLLIKLNIPHFNLMRLNTAKNKSGINRQHYSRYYNDDTKGIISQKYARDIEYFGYKFGE